MRFRGLVEERCYSRVVFCPDAPIMVIRERQGLPFSSANLQERSRVLIDGNTLRPSRRLNEVLKCGIDARDQLGHVLPGRRPRFPCLAP